MSDDVFSYLAEWYVHDKNPRQAADIADLAIRLKRPLEILPFVSRLLDDCWEKPGLEAERAYLESLGYHRATLEGKILDARATSNTACLLLADKRQESHTLVKLSLDDLELTKRSQPYISIKCFASDGEGYSYIASDEAQGTRIVRLSPEFDGTITRVLPLMHVQCMAANSKGLFIAHSKNTTWMHGTSAYYQLVISLWSLQHPPTGQHCLLAQSSAINAASVFAMESAGDNVVYALLCSAQRQASPGQYSLARGVCGLRLDGSSPSKLERHLELFEVPGALSISRGPGGLLYAGMADPPKICILEGELKHRVGDTVGCTNIDLVRGYDDGLILARTTDNLSVLYKVPFTRPQ